MAVTASKSTSPLEIVYEDSEIFALNKPSGIHSAALHNDKGGDSIAKWLLSFHPELSEVSDKKEDAGLIHRLDFETSGVLIVAKSREAWIRLRSDLLNGQIKKSYVIIVDGIIKKPISTNAEIGARYRRSKKMHVADGPRKELRAQAAHTDFTPLKTSPNLNISLLRCYASSAGRHQIRVHAAHLEMPLTGDSLYGSKQNLSELIQIPSAPPFFLHAESVSLKTSADETLEIRCDNPLTMSFQ